MEEKIDLLLLDNSNNLVEERNVQKPNTYNELKSIIKIIFKYEPEFYLIFYRNEFNNEVIINNDEEYKLSKDILFIREVKYVNNSQESEYSINYDKLSESKQDILDEKYNCNICEIKIKDEKPLLCYRCQKIFHKKCLENWNGKCIQQNNAFSCPKCKYDLPLKDWKEKLNYNEERLNEVNIMKELVNKDQSNNGIKSEYTIFKLNTYNTYENILNKIGRINSLFEENSIKIENNIVDNNKYDMSNKIFEGLVAIENSVKNINKKNIKEIPIEKLICKILYETSNNGETTQNKVIGFFCEFGKKFPIKYCLFTNNYILKEESRKNDKSIEIVYCNELGYYTKKIEINKKRRVYSNNKLNYTCIEILESDNIKYYFKFELEVYENNINLIDKEVFMLQYLNNNNLSFTFGKILLIRDNIIEHNIPFNSLYFGSPIIIKSDNMNYIIGLSCGEDKFNLATKFNIILDNLKDQIQIQNDDKTEIKNEIVCIYYAENNMATLSLLHDYDYIFNAEDRLKETKESHYEARIANQNFFAKNIDLEINDKKVDFTFRYEIKFSYPQLIKAKFKFKKLLHNMSFMFSGCRDLISIDLSSFNSSKVNNMSNMFRDCEKLQIINFTSINTRKVVNMKCMFFGCKALNSLDLSPFNTNKVIDMSEMFTNCSSLQSLNLKSFKVKNVINMTSMFSYCSSLISLDLSSFNTCNVINMSYMFNFCSKLTSLDLSLFNTECSNTYKMFNFCNSLQKQNIKIKNKKDKITKIRKIGIKINSKNNI